MGDLVVFDRELRRLADGAIRPFLCDGSPFDCDVFLVGLNPRVTVQMWPHWSTDRGCDKAGWMKDLRERNLPEGPTRKRLELLCKAIGPERVLETNVFHHRSENEAALDSALKQTTVFEFLLDTVKPKVVFVHGKSAVAHLEDMTKVKTKLRDFVSASWRSVRFELITGQHLSRGWKYRDVDELGRRIKERCPKA